MTSLGSSAGSRAIPVSNMPMAIVVWTHLIKALLRPWSSESEAVWDELVGYRIHRAYVCKKYSMNEHEYLIVRLSKPGLKEPLFLLLERSAGARRENPKPTPSRSTTSFFSSASSKRLSHPPLLPLSDSPTTPTSPVDNRATRMAGPLRPAARGFTYPPPLSRPSDITSNKYLAADTVEKLDGFPTSAKVIKIVEFNSDDWSKRPSLWELMILAYVIHNDSVTYELFQRQCFWFADSISAILENWAEATDDVSIINEKAARSRFLRRNKSPGSVGPFVVHRRDPNVVDKIRVKFKEKQDEMNKERREYEVARVEELRRTKELQKQVEDLKRRGEEREREFKREFLVKEREWELRLQQQAKEKFH